jgi:predicted O-linked N-acetylglucosamine transferase (SPINDLY family)
LGSLNKYNKVRGETLALWAKVMRALPKAKLLLKDRAPHEGETHERILTTLASHGVLKERVVFLPPVHDGNFRRHMQIHDRLDIALDTIPFNSGTTAFDALWMGVPLVAMEGSRICGRMGASIVTALGRPEWVAKNEEEYASIVCRLAADVEGRKKLRRARECLLCNVRFMA